MGTGYILLGGCLVLLFTLTVSSVSAFKFDKNDYVNVEVSSPSGGDKTFSFNVDYLWFQGDDHNDPIFIHHNMNSKQQTIKTHRGDLWTSNFNLQSAADQFGGNGWLVKTSNDGVKVKNSHIVLNGKSTKLPINCLDGCTNFAFHLPNNIKKGTYQIVYEVTFDTDDHQAWYTDKVIIK
jgi:hypothetical protein